jgi:DNA-binding NarL/FixJ family response regulator
MKNLSILIADDHPVVRQGLRQMLRTEFRAVFDEAATVAQALQFLQHSVYDLIILDIGIPETDGFDLLRLVRALHPDIRILMLSIHDDPQYAIRALELGARGYVNKNAGRAEIIRAVSVVLAGKTYVSKAVAVRLRAVPGDEVLPHARLSPRERQVMLALARGRRPAEIAAELKINAKTVSTFRRRILDKLGVASTAELVRYAIEHQLIGRASGN